MVNALDYINSRDIRKYWEEIGYKASPWETAWLIWQSRKHTLKEKLDAWQSVAKEYSRELCPPFRNLWSKFCPVGVTLGSFLQTYINLENDLLEQFYFKGNACFSISYIRYLRDEWTSEPDRVFPSRKPGPDTWRRRFPRSRFSSHPSRFPPVAEAPPEAASGGVSAQCPGRHRPWKRLCPPE